MPLLPRSVLLLLLNDEDKTVQEPKRDCSFVKGIKYDWSTLCECFVTNDLQNRVLWTSDKTV